MNERGFSLVELLAAVAIFAMVAAGIYALQQQGMNAFLFTSGRVDAQQNARLSLNQIEREFLTATAVTAAPNCATGAADITFTFLDPFGALVTVQYFRDGANLQRNQTVPALANQPATLIAGVQGFTIVCFDGGSPLPVATGTLANIRSIDITLTVTNAGPTVGGLANQNVVVQSRVRARNL